MLNIQYHEVPANKFDFYTGNIIVGFWLKRGLPHIIYASSIWSMVWRDASESLHLSPKKFGGNISHMILVIWYHRSTLGYRWYANYCFHQSIPGYCICKNTKYCVTSFDAVLVLFSLLSCMSPIYHCVIVLINQINHHILPVVVKVMCATLIVLR